MTKVVSKEYGLQLLRLSHDHLCALQNKFGLPRGLRIDMSQVPRQAGLALLSAHDVQSRLEKLFCRGVPTVGGALPTIEQLVSEDEDVQKVYDPVLVKLTVHGEGFATQFEAVQTA